MFRLMECHQQILNHKNNRVMKKIFIKITNKIILLLISILVFAPSCEPDDDTEDEGVFYHPEYGPRQAKYQISDTVANVEDITIITYPKTE